MNRRDMLGLSLAATGGIFVPQFGRWFRQFTLRDDVPWVQRAIDRGEVVKGRNLVFRSTLIITPETKGGLEFDRITVLGANPAILVLAPRRDVPVTNSDLWVTPA